MSATFAFAGLGAILWNGTGAAIIPNGNAMGLSLVEVRPHCVDAFGVERTRKDAHGVFCGCGRLRGDPFVGARRHTSSCILPSASVATG